MFQQAKWFGFSLALHLTVGASLVVVASHNAERAPKTIMVVLDDFMPPELPQKKPAKAVVRPVSPPRALEPAQPELPRQVLQPAVPPAATAAEQTLTRDEPKSAPDVPAGAATRPAAETGNPAPAVATQTALQPAAPAAEERPTPEKAQQRYLKEHFSYIRDMITRRLAYPPMARKMHWSGKVVVAFVIAEDGTVHNLRVVNSSGFPVLDRSAAETVRNVAPFPKPPVRAEITLPINFRMMQ